MSAKDALRRLAEQVSLLGSECRRLNAENKKLRSRLDELTTTTGNTTEIQNRGHLRLVEPSGSSLLDREQLIARLEEMLEELAEIV